MPKRNIEDIYKLLGDMSGELESLITNANELVASVNLYGGEIKRIIVEQMTKYFIPTITNLKQSTETPGSIIGISNFLDSVPLSFTREAPNAMEELPINDAVQPNLSMPASSTIDQTQEIPRGASYQNPQGIQEAKEKKEKREYSKYRIYRKSKSLSSLGKEGKIEPTAVAEYNSKREAECHCRSLNDSITPEEKSILGTEYFVKEEKFEDNLIKA